MDKTIQWQDHHVKLMCSFITKFVIHVMFVLITIKGNHN